MLLGALALVVVLVLVLVPEGALTFLSATSWRSVFSRVLAMSDGQIRLIALSSMVAGMTMLLFLLP